MSYTIGEVSEKLNISTHNLRYYESEGLLSSIDRDINGRRVFKSSDLNMLDIIESLKASGLPIKEIKKYIDLCSGGDSTIRLRYELFIERKQIIKNQIDFLHKLMKTINYKCNFYEDALNGGTTMVCDFQREELADRIMNDRL